MMKGLSVGMPDQHPGQETRVNVSREDPWDSRDPDVTDEQGTFLSAVMGKHLKPQSGDVLQETTAQSIHTGGAKGDVTTECHVGF